MAPPIDMVGFGRGGGGGSPFPSSADLQGSWNLFGGDVSQTDNSANGNDLTPSGAPGQASGGGPDGVNCADLEASTGQSYSIDHASQTGLSPGSGALSGCIFYNPESLGTNQFLMGKYINSGNGEWYLWYDLGDDRFEFVVRHSGGGVTVHTASAPSVAAWHFLAFYIDPVAQEIGIARNNGAFDTASFTASVLASTAPFTIGVRGNTGNDLVDGRCAIAHVWDVVVTASQWTSLYNAGNGLRYSP